MRISIIDDELYWRERIRSEIVQYDKDNEIKIDLYESGEQYLESRKQYDISFVDIQMQDIDGFETITRARAYNPDGIYVILTTHTEMSRKGYVVNAFRYIYKTEIAEIQEAIESAEILLGRNKKIKVNVIGGGNLELVLKNIIYIETEKHYVLIHTKHGVIKCNETMIDIENMLSREWFYRCHKAYIVNLDEISRINDRIVYLSNGDDIDVSQRKISQFKKLYLDRQYECANK